MTAADETGHETARKAAQETAKEPTDETSKAPADATPKDIPQSSSRGGLRAAKAPVIGLALGAGAARGWSHIGVLQGLNEIGVRPDVVAGCSSGALVGAAYISGRLDELGEFAESLTWARMLRFFDISWRGGGLIEGKWLVDLFRDFIDERSIEELETPFGAVATELASGRETWLVKGSMLDAVRASIALPGLITPIPIEGRWLVDGALVNPLPVSLCRALGAQIIIGVSMQGDLVTRRAAAPIAPTPAPPPATGALAAKAVDPDSDEGAALAAQTSWLQWLAGARGQPMVEAPADRDPYPARLGYLDVIGDSLFIVQNFISRVRLAADPVEALIAPDVSSIGVMDFYRGREAIEIGRRAVEASADEILAICGGRAPPPALDVVHT